MRDALEPQDLLYTVVQRDPAGDEARVVGAMTRYLFGPDDPSAVVRALAHPRTRLVTLTVTGDGYKIDPATGLADGQDEEVLADLLEPDAPRTVLGYLTAALRERRRAGAPPLTLMSCDNLPRNGEALRRALVSFAAHGDAKLAAWIERNVSFPCTVVDRITPRTDTEARVHLAGAFGIRDRWPVVTERFSQWVIEDRFAGPRPPLDEVGARFVDDTGPYELVKKRLLNGSHCALGYLGYLSDHRQTDEAMADPRVSTFIRHLMDQEIRPLLPEPPGIDLGDYRSSLLERFANPAIGDTLDRLCRRGSTKMPAYLLPSLREAIRGGRPSEGLTLAVAAWIRYLSGTDLSGSAIAVVDPLLAELQPLAKSADRDVRPLLARGDVFGDLGSVPGFSRRLASALARLDRLGPGAAMDACVGGDVAVAA